MYLIITTPSAAQQLIRGLLNIDTLELYYVSKW